MAQAIVRVAAWFVDSDYDGRTFCITEAFFPDRSAWEKLAKALKAVGRGIGVRGTLERGVAAVRSRRSRARGGEGDRPAGQRGDAGVAAGWGEGGILTCRPAADRPYRMFFYAGDRAEPVHVHVERDDRVAKFWLNPVRLASSGGFSRVELGRIHALVTEHRDALTEKWHDYFGE